MTTPTPEQLVATLARKWKLDIELPKLTAPTEKEWVPVRAIQSMTPGGEPTMQDDSDYDSDGWASSVKTLQSWTIETTVIRKVGVTSNKYDRGQEALRAAAFQFGAAGTVRIRWYDRDGRDEAYAGYASVTWAEAEGGVSALSTATVTLTGQGKRETITNPNAPAGGSSTLAAAADADESTGGA